MGSSGNPDVFTLRAVAEDLWYTSCWVAHREGPRLTTSAVLSCHQLRLISERSMSGVETTRSERTGLQSQSLIEVMIFSFARSQLVLHGIPSLPLTTTISYKRSTHNCFSTTDSPLQCLNRTLSTLPTYMSTILDPSRTPISTILKIVAHRISLIGLSFLNRKRLTLCGKE